MRRAHRVLNSHIPDAEFQKLSLPTLKTRSPSKFRQGHSHNIVDT